MKLSKKKTKIVATIGPATESEKTLAKLFHEGLDIIRLNFSHNTEAWHQETLDRARTVAKKMGKTIAILQDLSGPKIRIGEVKDNHIILKKGKPLILTTEKILGDETKLSINYKKLPQELKKGDIIKIEDGKKTLLVEKTSKKEIYTKIIDGGVLSSHKGINVPGAHLSIASLTEKDKRDLLFGIKNNVAFIAFSFVKTAKDVRTLKNILKKHKSKALVIAKIETAPAIEHFDEILAEADGIMIARGDLAIEVGVERVPLLQKEMIQKCIALGKPVITATQMLDSMENSPVPTRAEVSDVANAILDGTDAIMLSGETSTGRYPVEALTMMRKIAEETESFYEDFRFLKFQERENTSLVDAITHSVWHLAEDLQARYIISFTESGFTARMLSRFRPEQKILAFTPHRTSLEQLKISFGVEGFLMPLKNAKDAIQQINTFLKKEKLAKKGDKIVLTFGSHFGKPGSTDNIFVFEIA